MDLRSLAVLVCLAGCTAPQVVAPHAPGPRASALEASEERRVALFHELAAKVREVHVFSENTTHNLGLRWLDEAPELLADFRRATSRRALQQALFHFGASLHDSHCRYRPEGADPRVRLPLRFEAFLRGGTASYRVVSVGQEGAGSIAVGDELATYDGVPAADLLHHHRNVSNMNQWPLIAEDVASYLARRRHSATTARAGSPVTLSVTAPGGVGKTVTLAWSEASQGGDGSDFSADYGDKSCGPEAPEYGHGYAIAARGHGLCLYESREAAFAPYPIVYQWTFRYWDDALDGQYVVADQALLQSALARANPRGVVLDVRDNGGGNNSNLFLDWWAPAAYADMYTRVRLIPALHTAAEVDERLLNMGGQITTSYLAELSTPKVAPFTAPRPFACPASGCDWNNRYTPAHRVTAAPLALLVGGGCNSACAAFVLLFEHNHWAPLVGTSTMAGYTTHRYRHVLPEGLGTIDFASSEDTMLPGGASVEGKPTVLTEEVARTWENHTSYESVLVERAIARLPQ